MKSSIVFFWFVLIMPVSIYAQIPDSSVLKKDSVTVTETPVAINRYQSAQLRLLERNKLLNSKGAPVYLVVKQKQIKSNNEAFYLLMGLILLLAVIKFFYVRYFANMFRVFFNTSLRQSQLTDQLLQSKLPSLLFNTFFIITGGIYVYFLLLHFQLITLQIQWMIVGTCILTLGLVYLVKYSVLKTTGWLTGYKEITDNYIFIIFLVCKIIGVVILPFTILMVFSEYWISHISAIASLLIIGFLLLLRFIRSYGLMQDKLKISNFHLILYIIGVEILPLLLLYKGVLILLNKNL